MTQAHGSCSLRVTGPWLGQKKDLINSQKENFFFFKQIPGGQGHLFLPARAAANQNAGYASSCRLADSDSKMRLQIAIMSLRDAVVC